MNSFKNNKGKFILLAIYGLAIFISPLQYFTSGTQNQLVAITKSMVSDEAGKFFGEYIDLLHQGNLDKAYSLMTKDAQESVSKDSLKTLSTYFASTTNEMEIVGGNVNTRTDSQGSVTTYDVVYEVKANDSKYPYQIVEVTAVNVGQGIQILGVNVAGQTESVKKRGRFDFSSQGLVLILSILIPLFIIYTGYRYLTKAKNPKWMLFLVILLGTAYIQIVGPKFGVSFGFSEFMSKAGPWGPWVFVTPFPIGAIYYYFVYKHHEL